MWQDVVIFVASLVFVVSLLPLVRVTMKGTAAPPIATTLPTTGGLVAISVCYATLGLPISCAITLVSAALWGSLVVLGLRQRGKSATI
jgi:hypothetical protein